MRQTGRYELKYVLDEERARAVADYVRTYLGPSPRNDSGPVVGHPVISLYMDSPDFALYQQVCEGRKNRIKLRIRFYDNNWKRPAVMEIKHRTNDVICKDRAVISREGVRQFLNGGWPCPSFWPEQSALMHGRRQFDVYYTFWKLATTLHARGVVYVSYVREAFESPTNDELRVTFDRQVRGTAYDGTGKLHVPSRGCAPENNTPPHYLPHDGVILEMKYDERAPMWMYDMVRIFNLQRRPMCKYNACVDAVRAPLRRVPSGSEKPLVVAQWTS